MKLSSVVAKEAFLFIVQRDLADLGLPQPEHDERITVLADLDHFNAKEDESVWLQKKGKADEYFEIYFDEVWICDFKESESPKTVRVRFLKGFLNAYEAEDISINKGLAQAKRDAKVLREQKRKDDEISAVAQLPASTPEEKLSKEIITELVKEKNELPA